MADALKAKGFEYARFEKVRKSAYSQDMLPAFSWLINTFLKLNNMKFDIMDDQKKLAQLVQEQLLSKTGETAKDKTACRLI